MHSFKTPAFMYAKEFKLDKVLGNLQGYKIATGQVSNEELRNVSRKFGSDEGAVFGSLITNASCLSNREGDSSSNGPPAKRQRRKRRKGAQGKEVGYSASDMGQKLRVHHAVSNETLSIPAALLEHCKDNASSDDDDDNATKSNRNSTSDDCSSSNTDGEDSDVDFFGLHNATKSSKPTKTSSASETYIPHQERRHSSLRNVQEDAAIWDPVGLKYKERMSMLSTYKCWKCRRVGHLPEDCTVNVKSNKGLLSDSETLGRGQQNQPISKRPYFTSNLKDYYKRCQKLRESKDVTCSDCGAKSNLVYCFECGLVLCDGRGHLIEHLLEHPRHTKLFSYKLQRQIKCCKSTCEVVDATELLQCSSCLDKTFTSHYSMINATWSKAGLKAIPNTLACEQHFRWHRMNCANPSGETLMSREKLESCKMKGEGLLSEFFF